MTTHFALVSIVALGLASTAQAEEKARPTLMVMPFEGRDVPLGDIGHAALLRTFGVLRATGDFNLVHPKQLNRVLQYYEHRLAEVEGDQRLARVGTVLGADWVITGWISTKPPEMTMEIKLSALQKRETTTKKWKGADLLTLLKILPGQLNASLSELGVRKGETPKEEEIAPITTSEEALLRYAACHRILIQQPISIRSPVLLDATRLGRGIQYCNDALRKDKKLADAKAALGLLYALNGERHKAERHLKMVKDSKVFLPSYWIGKFWVVSRHHDVDHAVRTLEAALVLQPGFMLARGYLGDALSTVGRYDESYAVFESYLKAVPRQPWVMGRLGYVASKKGEKAKAIEWTKKALRLAPSDSELLLEMASRYVDDKQYKEASTILRRIVGEGGARGEVHLRLGYTYLKLNELPKAEREFHKAILLSTSNNEWRTRGRARYDLAKLWMRSGSQANALRHLRRAIEEGYHDRSMFEADKDFSALKKNPTFRKLMKKKRRAPRPTYLSPFRLDPSTGRVDIAVKKGKKKKKTIILHF